MSCVNVSMRKLQSDSILSLYTVDTTPTPYVIMNNGRK